MPVPNRIKIIQVSNFEDAENKINDFLAFNKDIVQLLGIEYKLEYNFVILDYIVADPHHHEHTNNEKEESSYGCTPITWWWKLCLPSSYYPY